MADNFEEILTGILREEIDKEIIAEIRISQLLDNDWTLVSAFISDGTEVGPWIQENIKGDWRAFIGGRYMFELQDDATLFKMRWL